MTKTLDAIADEKSSCGCTVKAAGPKPWPRPSAKMTRASFNTTSMTTACFTSTDASVPKKASSSSPPSMLPVTPSGNRADTVGWPWELPPRAPVDPDVRD
jgi:hypothetical protein